MRRLIGSSVVVGLALLFSMLPVSGTRQALADPEAVNYSYLLGVPPLCDLGPSACPDIVMAANGDTVAITGTGTLTTHPNSVTGGGTFTHNFADGGSVSGTWTAEELISFDGYGCDPTLFPPFLLCGGHAIIRVHLTAGPAEADGILQVDCLIGDFPAGGTEGVRLAVSGIDTPEGRLPGINFNKEVSGVTVFIDLDGG